MSSCSITHNVFGLGEVAEIELQMFNTTQMMIEEQNGNFAKPVLSAAAVKLKENDIKKIRK